MVCTPRKLLLQLKQAILTGKGRITLPAELRRRWGLKPGDRIDFSLEDNDQVLMTRKVRRIFKSREELAPLSLGRPLTQEDIDRAVADAMTAQGPRVRQERHR
jgi:AbrB family looped-hinge helix DNA binding protein